jgi:hypothetical protein
MGDAQLRSFLHAPSLHPPYSLSLLLGVQDAGGAPFTEAELTERFDALTAEGVRAVGIWRSPVPDNWWPFLRSLQQRRA